MVESFSRREFMAGASALVGAMHLPQPGESDGKVKPKTFIKSVRIQTAADLQLMEDFYRSNLGFILESKSKSELCLVAGGSTLRFVKVEAVGQRPITHFAFNIPENMVRSALDHMQKRIEVILPGPSQCAVDYPKEIWHFHHWNAHSVFFWDPGFNLVELISRHDLSNAAPGMFTPKHIHCISEIAFGSKDGQPRELVQTELGLPNYPKGPSSFALGDQNGLLLFFNVGRVWGASSKTPQTLQTHMTEVEIQGSNPKTLNVPGYPFTIKVTP